MAFGTLHVGDLGVEALGEHHPHVGVASGGCWRRGGAVLPVEPSSRRCSTPGRS